MAPILDGVYDLISEITLKSLTEPKEVTMPAAAPAARPPTRRDRLPYQDQSQQPVYDRLLDVKSYGPSGTVQPVDNPYLPTYQNYGAPTSQNLGYYGAGVPAGSGQYYGEVAQPGQSAGAPTSVNLGAYFTKQRRDAAAMATPARQPSALEIYRNKYGNLPVPDGMSVEDWLAFLDQPFPRGSTQTPTGYTEPPPTDGGYGDGGGYGYGRYRYPRYGRGTGGSQAREFVNLLTSIWRIPGR